MRLRNSVAGRGDRRATCAGVYPAHEGRCLVPRTARATSANHADAASRTSVDELVRRGREHGRLSVTELRSAFSAAGISPAEAQAILRGLADEGVQLGSKGGNGGRAKSAKRAAVPGARTPADGGAGTSKDAMPTAQTIEPAAEEMAAIVGLDNLDDAAEPTAAATNR